MIDEYNNIGKISQQVDVFNTHMIEVGVLANGFLQMIAVVNNDGAVIHAKSSEYLMIPYRENGKLKFAKKKSVTIPARRFLERTMERHESRWQTEARKQFIKIADGNGTAMMALNMLGHLMVTQMKSEIVKFKVPHNAKLTIANKGKDDPLIDTGALRDAINYRIVTKH